MVQLSRGSLVAAGSALALGAAQLPWLAARLALAGIGAWLLAFGLGLAPATALFCAAGYLGSGALLLYGPRGDPASYASFAEIGTGIAALALLLAWRRASPPAPGPRWAGALGVLLALGACTWGARWLGVWLAAPVALFALAGLSAEQGVLRGRNAVQALALFAAVLALRFPDRCALFAAPAALGLALCAGDALESAPRAARALGAAAFVLLAASSLYAARNETGAALPEHLDEQDQWVRWHERPSRAGTLAWEVEVDARVPVAAVSLLMLSSGEEARRIEFPMQREPCAGGARFRNAPVALAQLPEPAWSVRLELLGPEGQQPGERVIGALLLPHPPRFSPALLGFVLAALCLAFARASAVRLALGASALVVAQACWFYVLS